MSLVSYWFDCSSEVMKSRAVDSACWSVLDIVNFSVICMCICANFPLVSVRKLAVSLLMDAGVGTEMVV
jgi:hypothetical protein